MNYQVTKRKLNSDSNLFLDIRHWTSKFNSEIEIELTLWDERIVNVSSHRLYSWTVTPKSFRCNDIEVVDFFEVIQVIEVKNSSVTVGPSSHCSLPMILKHTHLLQIEISKSFKTSQTSKYLTLHSSRNH